jgi:drug/metabolite transporter (DMT)-like permease
MRINISHKSGTMYLVLLFGILCISWSAIFVKLAGISGLGSAFYRMFIGSLGIIPFWIYYRKPITDFKAIKIAVLCGFFFGCDISLWNTSILMSKAAVATLLANLAPVWVGLGAILFFREKTGKIFWTGTFMAIAGVIIIVGVQNIFYSTLSLGNILSLIASMFYGAYLLTTRFGRSGLDTVTFTAISMFTSSLVVFLFCIISHTQLWGFETHTWISLAGLGIISQLLGWLAINFTLRYIHPTVASVSLLSQSVFTALLSMPLLHEYLNFIEISGAVLVLLGIYLVNREKSKKNKSNSTVEKV